MGHQIIRQPDDRLAIFSTYTDTIIVWDATADEVMQWFVDLAVERTRRDVGRLLENVEGGTPEKVYHQFAMTWDEALEEDREHDGEAGQHFKPHAIEAVEVRTSEESPSGR